MVAQWIVEKYKQREREIGIKIGIERGLQQVRENPLECMAWYERKQAALREGRPFTEPPPGYSPKGDDNGNEAGIKPASNRAVRSCNGSGKAGTSGSRPPSGKGVPLMNQRRATPPIPPT